MIRLIVTTLALLASLFASAPAPSPAPLLASSPAHQLPQGNSTGHGTGGGGTTVLFANYCNGSGSGTSQICEWSAVPAAGSAAAILIWHSTSSTISTVCDGTGTGGCTSSSTYSLAGSYTNGTNFTSDIWITCNFAGSTDVTVTPSASVQLYIDGVSATGNTTTGTNCNDGTGPKNNQSTTAVELTAGALTTTNAHSLLLFLASNNCGGTAYTAGVDGQGNAMTDSGAANSGVLQISYRQQSATNTYTPTAATGPACGSGGNAQAFAFK
jgi:hypothetical protein